MALGALLTNVNTGVPAVTVLGITVGNTLEAVVGAYLLRTVAGFRPRLERVRDVLALAVFGAVISTIVSATIGVASLLMGDNVVWADAPSVWRTWWLGDMGGDLIVAPALLVAATHRPFFRAPGRALEGLALALSLVGVTVLIFSQHTGLTYLLFPFLVWAALRFWQPGAAAASLLIAAVGVTFTANGEGPFAMSGPDERLILAQTLVAVATMTAFVLAAVTSERGRAEQAAREIASTLQESLLPARLPELPKLDCATFFRPAGEGRRVGGDFYDVFEAGDGSWALVVGDMCGKGPHAAALTALARYTVRAAAVHDQLPSRVLATLNDAVLRHDAEEFCTAIYARLDLNGSTTRVTVSSGGHPLPLVVRADGRVKPVGRPGMILGADPAPPLADQSIDLLPGEALLFYTDGLLDAYAPQRIVQVSELESILRSCAGQKPAQMIAAIEQALLIGPEAEPRDDVAIVVLQRL